MASDPELFSFTVATSKAGGDGYALITHARQNARAEYLVNLLQIMAPKGTG
jgi:hypothetical protein